MFHQPVSWTMLQGDIIQRIRFKVTIVQTKMDFRSFLSSHIAAQRQSDVNVDAGFVEQYIHTIEDIRILLEFCDANSTEIAPTIKSAGWELFDKVFVLSVNESISTAETKLLFRVIFHISENTRAREVCMMAAEKLSTCTEISTFKLLVYAMQLAAIRSDNPDVWKQGMLACCLVVILCFAEAAADHC